jgi:hypothetical protein
VLGLVSERRILCGLTQPLAALRDTTAMDNLEKAHGQELQDMVYQAIRLGLENRMRRPERHPPFLLEDDIQQSWEEAGDTAVNSLLESLGVPSTQMNLAKKASIKFISTQIWIGTRDWSSFAALFSSHHGQMDDIMPLLTTDTLLELPADQVVEHGFFAAQYRFLPLTITQDRDLGSVRTECPLPFLESHILAEYSDQVVTRELIAAKHLRYTRSGHPQANLLVIVFRHADGLGLTE